MDEKTWIFLLVILMFGLKVNLFNLLSAVVKPTLGNVVSEHRAWVAFGRVKLKIDVAFGN
jgi:hypothetical protein